MIDARAVRRRSRVRGYAVVLLLAALIAMPTTSASAAGCRHQGLKADKHNVRTVDRAIRCLLNRERAQRGLKRLRSHRALRKAARRHSTSMVRKRYFDHTGADGASPKRRMKRAGYTGRIFAENITYGIGRRATPRSVVTRWMSSGEHRQNILGDYDHMGLGLALGNPRGRRGVTVTMTVGGR